MSEYLAQGGCLCGAVRFELTEAPRVAGYCHCTRCQRRTGTSSSISAAVNPAAFEWVTGEDLVKGWRPLDGGAEKCFCERCGGHLAARNPGTLAIRMSAFDKDPGIRPSYRQYVAYAAAWEAIPEDGIERFAEGRG